MTRMLTDATIRVAIRTGRIVAHGTLHYPS
jgi:hypothetical protein